LKDNRGRRVTEGVEEGMEGEGRRREKRGKRGRIASIRRQ